MANKKSKDEKLAEMQEPNSMAGVSQRVRLMGPGFGDQAESRPADESQTSKEAESFGTTEEDA